MVNLRQLSVFIAIALLAVIIAMLIFPLKVIDVRQLNGLPFPRAVIERGRPLGYQLVKNITITQTFRPGADNITGFGIFFSKILLSEPQGYLTVTLNVKKNGKFVTLYRAKRKASEIELNTINTFFFKPISVIKNTVYLIILEEDATVTGLSVYSSLKDPYKLGIAHLNKRPTKHDIVFQTYYKTSFLGYFKRGTKLNSFFLSIIFLIVLSGATILALFFNWENGES